MKTIALRLGERFAPDCGTITALQGIIDKLGYVWYGKMENPVSDKVIKEIMNSDSPKILFIRSGKAERYWAGVSSVTKETPAIKEIPNYYSSQTDKFKTWFKITSFGLTQKDVMAKYVVASSHTPLGSVSKHSMSSYFIIEEGGIS